MVLHLVENKIPGGLVDSDNDVLNIMVELILQVKFLSIILFVRSNYFDATS